MFVHKHTHTHTIFDKKIAVFILYLVQDGVVDLINLCLKVLAYICQDSPREESGLLKAVQNVHATIDKEIAAGTNPNNVFICGLSQGGISPISSLSLSLSLSLCVSIHACVCVCSSLFSHQFLKRRLRIVGPFNFGTNVSSL